MGINLSAWITGLIAGLVALALGVGWFFATLVILNGFGEREAEPMILTSVILSVTNIVVSAVLSGWLVGLFQRKAQVSAWVAGPLAIVAVSVVGIIIVIVGTWIGIAIFANPR